MQRQNLPSWFKISGGPSNKEYRVIGSRSSKSSNNRVEEQLKQEETLRCDFFTHCSNRVDNLLEASTDAVHDVALQNVISFVCLGASPSKKEDLEITTASSTNGRNADDSVTSAYINNGHPSNDFNKCERRNPCAASLMCQEDHATATTTAKRQKVDSSLLNFRPSANYFHRHILPCSILHTNSTAILDRSYLVQHFIHKNQFNNKRAKLCLLSRQDSKDVSSPFISSHSKDSSHSKTSPSASAAYSDITLADLMKRITLHCLSVDGKKNNNCYPENDSSYLWLVKKLKTISIRECMELIVHWAQQTSHFDCVVVVLEEIESISPLVIDGLLRSLVYLRSERALPISLVVFTCHHALEGLPSTISAGSVNGVEVKEWELSPPSMVIENIVALIFSFNNSVSYSGEEDGTVMMLQCILRNNLFRLNNSCIEFHGSFVSDVPPFPVIKEKMYHTRLFTVIHTHTSLLLHASALVAGSFVLALNCREFVEQNEGRIARCICVLSNDCEFLGTTLDCTNTNNNEKKSLDTLKFKDWATCSSLFLHHGQMFSDVLAMTTIVSRSLENTNDVSKKNDIFTSCSTGTIFNELLDIYSGRRLEGKLSGLGELLHAMNNSDSLKLLEIMKLWRDELHIRSKSRKMLRIVCMNFIQDDTNNNSINNTFADNVYEEINESIILFQEMLVNRIDLRKAVHLDLVSWFYELIKEGCGAKKISMSDGTNSLPCTNLLHYIQRLMVSSYPDSTIEAQPRRIVASALTLPQLFMDVREIMHDSCIAFQTVKSTRKIGCSDWFCAVQDSAQSLFPRNKKVSNWLRFAFSVYELSFCGLIRKVDDSVEKVAMVWGNG